MIFSENDVVYCDANFLIAYGAKKVKQPELKKRALVLFAQILVGKCKLITSTLTFDETWLGIRKELGPKSIRSSFRLKFSGILEKLGLKFINGNTAEFSYVEIFDDLSFFTSKLMNYENFSVVQFKDPKGGVKTALDNLNSLRFKPRDAFHLAFAKDNEATYFLTNDSHFSKNKDKVGINIRNF